MGRFMCICFGNLFGLTRLKGKPAESAAISVWICSKSKRISSRFMSARVFRTIGDTRPENKGKQTRSDSPTTTTKCNCLTDPRLNWLNVLWHFPLSWAHSCNVVTSFIRRMIISKKMCAICSAFFEIQKTDLH